MRIGLVTDIHLAPPGHPPQAWHNCYRLADAADRFGSALAQCVDAGAEAIAVLGDLSHLGDDATLSQGVEIAAAAGRPVWFVAGNHDLNRDRGALAKAIERSGSTDTRLLGLDSVRASDNVTVAGIPLAYGLASDGAARAVIGEPDWGDGLVLVVTHYPIVSLADRVRTAGLKYAGDLTNLSDVAAMVRRSGPTVVVHGHLHVGHIAAFDSMLQISCAALIEPPFECTVLEVDTDSNEISVRSLSAPVATAPDVALPVLSPSDQTWTFTAGSWQQSARSLIDVAEEPTR